MVNKGKKRIANLKQTSSTLLLTKGKGDDFGKMMQKAKEPVNQKGKVIITKPTKASTAMFTRRTSRKTLKMGEEAEDIIFKKPPPTFQEILKGIDLGYDIFKALRYETKIVDEKKQVEDMVISKLRK